jgi:hypothetical protein
VQLANAGAVAPFLDPAFLSHGLFYIARVRQNLAPVSLARHCLSQAAIRHDQMPQQFLQSRVEREIIDIYVQPI